MSYAEKVYNIKPKPKQEQEYEPVERASLSLYELAIASDDGEGASSSELKRFDKIIHKWGYDIISDIPITEKFIEYASKSDCFIQYLLDSNRIQVKKKDEFKPYTLTIEVENARIHNTLYCLTHMKYNESIISFKEKNGMVAFSTDSGALKEMLKRQLRDNKMNKTVYTPK